MTVSWLIALKCTMCHVYMTFVSKLYCISIFHCSTDFCINAN
uniref:Uncharacterized protein n=1 Tax=Anguilla anguilla TaxID=7936 RepID=A0A0E9TVW0_ANGAN